jgi:hypothetical protein
MPSIGLDERIHPLDWFHLKMEPGKNQLNRPLTAGYGEKCTRQLPPETARKRLRILRPANYFQNSGPVFPEKRNGAF